MALRRTHVLEWYVSNGASGNDGSGRVTYCSNFDVKRKRILGDVGESVTSDIFTSVDFNSVPPFATPAIDAIRAAGTFPPHARPEDTVGGAAASTSTSLTYFFSFLDQAILEIIAENFAKY